MPWSAFRLCPPVPTLAPFFESGLRRFLRWLLPAMAVLPLSVSHAPAATADGMLCVMRMGRTGPVRPTLTPVSGVTGC
ncbi:hypothetical protein GCM10009664_18930 [Kitasatospora gansuensis]